jgi:hypothetical protein
MSFPGVSVLLGLLVSQPVCTGMCKNVSDFLEAALCKLSSISYQLITLTVASLKQYAV